MNAIDSDFVVTLNCGCKVTYFASSDLRSSRMDCCGEHARRDQAEVRDKIKRIADRAKFQQLDVMPRCSIPERWFR